MLWVGVAEATPTQARRVVDVSAGPVPVPVRIAAAAGLSSTSTSFEVIDALAVLASAPLLLLSICQDSGVIMQGTDPLDNHGSVGP